MIRFDLELSARDVADAEAQVGAHVAAFLGRPADSLPAHSAALHVRPEVVSTEGAVATWSVLAEVVVP